MYIGEGLLEPVRKYFIKLKLMLITLVHQVVWVLPFPSASAGGRAAAQAMCVCARQQQAVNAEPSWRGPISSSARSQGFL